MKILFLHGWHSVVRGVKPTFLKDHGHEVLNPILHNDDFAEAVRTAQAEFDGHRPEVVVGSSRGGAVAMSINSGDTPLVLLCPAWKNWGTATKVKANSVSEYHQWKQTGGDPYFDSLPWPLNPDSRQVRETGMAEPRTSFVPPANWKFQCPVCGAKQPSRVCVCWDCRYGQDGDSTAFFERFGDNRPPEISEQEWAEIRRRHDV